MAQHGNYWFGTCPTKYFVTSGIVRNVDILIIGGGIVGLSLLTHLINAGHTNTYLVEESTVGFHGSGRSSGQLLLRGGKLFSQMPENDGIEYLHFIVENNRRFLNGLRNVHFDTDLRDSGGLRLASTTEELFLLSRESQFLKTHQGLDCPILSKEEAQHIVPNSPFIGGMFVPNESMFNPYKVVNGIHELNEQRGSRVLNGCSVSNVEKIESGFAVSIRHRGTIKAKKIVYCTNSYTPELLPELSSIISIFRGQMLATDYLDNQVLQSLPQIGMTCNNANEYLRCHGGRLLIGSMRSNIRGQSGLVNDGEISPAAYDKLRTFAIDVFPIIKDIKFTHTWSGIMCSTPDGLPLIGKMPNRENEFVFCAFNGFGYSHALYGSWIIKDLISKGESSHPGTRLFDPMRFMADAI